eukprot:gene18480-20331_t
MDTLLKPARLDLDINSPTASKEWKHLHRTFTNFIAECGERAPDEYRTLINYVLFAHHLLATRRQKPGETLSEFLQELHRLSKDCNLKSVTAEQYREELVRDSFINGLWSPLIRQRVLENSQLDLKSAFDQANTSDLAQKNAEAYGMPQTPTTASDSSEGQPSQNVAPASPSTEPVAASFTSSRKRYFCGDTLHNRKNCP